MYSKYPLRISQSHTVRRIIGIVITLFVIANFPQLVSIKSTLQHSKINMPFISTAYADVNSVPTYHPIFFSGADETYAMVVGDVNNDGIFDIIVGNYRQKNLVYINNGKNGFMTRAFGNSTPTTSLALGDLNNDGFLDIIVGNQNQQGIFYLNDRAGNFPFGQPFGNTVSTNGLAVGDVNADGFLDIVAGNGGQQSVVYLNNGFTNFIAHPFGGTDPTESVALSDLNKDGFIDIVVGNFDAPNVVYMNDGAGNFPTALPFGRSDSTTRVVVGDLDNDGSPDIVFGNDSEPGLIIYPNDGKGNFLNYLYDTPKTQSIAVGDVNNDGYLDIVAGGLPGLVGAGPQGTLYINDENGRYILSPFGEGDFTLSLAMADMNSDGALDIIAANLGQQSAVYESDGAMIFPAPLPISDQQNIGENIAAGDFNGDGFLDVVSAGNPGKVYLNDETGAFPVIRSLSNSQPITATAVGDLNGDSFLDIATNSGIYLNDGAGNFPNILPFTVNGNIALGDFNTDGFLDIVAGTSVYLNDGKGIFSVGKPLANLAGFPDFAVGDFNGDGALDIVADTSIYLNDGTGNFFTIRQFGDAEKIECLVAGDFNDDGALDVVVGRFQAQSIIYFNDGTGNLSIAHPFGNPTFTRSLAVGDFNGDGISDIVAGNLGSISTVYLNNGSGDFLTANPFIGSSVEHVAVGDFNNDGALDIVASFGILPTAILLNGRIYSQRMPSDPPAISLIRPVSTGNANLYSTPTILDTRLIPIRYTLSDPEGDSVRVISATYSLDGGGSWRTAVPTNTVTTDLAASPAGTTHTFNWDIFASGFFGQSDNVVFRIVAYPSVRPRPNGVAGPYQRPYASATTFPFRVRGTQVQVTENGVPVANAQVYRLPNSKGGTFQPLAPGIGAAPYTTDAHGYLRGRGQIGIGDQLIAMRPIAVTDALSGTYTLFHTNINPTSTGVSGFIVNTPGVQKIEVSAAHPLALFPLDISLEWDAHNDQRFMNQLQSDLQRTSEFLFDATNGQAALGEVRIFQNKLWWDAVNLRIYASNRLRPNSVVGGMTTQPITDTVSLRPNNPVEPPVVYGPGQLRMGAVWNRFGNAGSNLSEDWPRTLAHELGHYLLFLEDNYIGTDAQNQIIPIDTCPGLMSDPYASNIELRPDLGWLPGCAQTLSNRSTGRSDWATVHSLFPALIAPSVGVADPSLSGPSNLPLAITQIRSETITATNTLDVPIFYLNYDNRRYQPGLTARGFLFSNHAADSSLPFERITPLGRANLDQILARGAHVGDRVCLYEPEKQIEGCTTASNGGEQITLVHHDAWPPDLTITPVTSTTLALRVAGVPADAQALGLQAQVFPADEEPPATAPVALHDAGTGVMTGTITLAAPVAEAHVYIWVNDPDLDSRREMVASLSLGGNPGYVRTGGGYVRTGGGYVRTGGGYVRTGGGYVRTGGGFARIGGAPVSSSEGDVLLLADNLTFQPGQFLALQSTSSLPTPPSWATLVGNAYRFTASASIPDLRQTSLSFNYLESDVPPGEESGIAVYFWNGANWKRLTTKLNTYYNTASVPNQGPGLYALMTSVDLRIAGPGWNLIAYPVHNPKPAPSVPQSLASINGYYTTVYGYSSTDSADPWKIYDTSAPDWVNDLRSLDYGKGYWINATQAITLYLKNDTSAPLAQAAPNPASIPTPPATYYGAVPGVLPQEALTVQAWVGTTLCGQTQSSPQLLHGTLQNTFAVNVSAAGSGVTAGCGTPGRTVRLLAKNGAREVWSITVAWDNSHAVEVRPTTVYVPFVGVPDRSVRDLQVVGVEVLPSVPQAAQPAEVRVTIRNAGTADITEPFWVDLYVDPSSTPQVNMLWSNLSTSGASWRVYGLRAGETRTLSTHSPNDPLEPGKNYSNFAGFVSAGSHQLYVLADSYAQNSPNGVVPEMNEQNNLLGPITVTVSAGRAAALPSASPAIDARPR